MKQPLFEIDINSSHYSDGMKESGGKYFYERLNVKKDSRPHYHNCYELEIVLSGKASQLVDGEKWGLIRGSVTFISPNQIHTINSVEGLELISIKISPDAISNELKNTLETMDFPISGNLDEDSLALFLRVFGTVAKSQSSNSALWSEAIMHQINSFMCIITHSFGKSSFPEHKKASKDMLKTVGFVKENILESITLKSVADEFGYTPNYFSAKFKELTGKGFARFVQDERLLLAYRAICTTDAPLSEISANCGFDSFPYFSRVFKAKYGAPPSFFREK